MTAAEGIVASIFKGGKETERETKREGVATFVRCFGGGEMIRDRYNIHIHIISERLVTVVWVSTTIHKSSNVDYGRDH